ncbi:hypothetical protein [Rhodobacteraceae bacterium DSL-40]|uniref:hypothetical protein n=1 Tax=Amaricoccus sp. B4 TaxID=3368557 RepID=UPI000DABB3BF
MNDTPAAPATPAERERAFALAEWTEIRAQMLQQLQQIWRFEVYVIGGLALLYAWIFTKAPQGDAILSRRLLLLLAVALAATAIFRLKIEYAILLTLGRYSERLEAYLYGAAEAPGGWQAYLGERKPDDLSFKAVFGRYSHAGWASSLMLAFTIVLLLAYGGFGTIPCTPGPATPAQRTAHLSARQTARHGGARPPDASRRSIPPGHRAPPDSPCRRARPTAPRRSAAGA